MVGLGDTPKKPRGRCANTPSQVFLFHPERGGEGCPLTHLGARRCKVGEVDGGSESL